MNLMETKQQLILAYETVLQPTSTIQARKDAENYCESLKLSGYLAFQIGTSLLDARNGHALHLRNLGVNFIEHSIKSDQLDALQLQNVKSQFWSLVFCEFGSFDPVNERILVKEKVANCMAILACKLWVRPEDDPAGWNDFFEIGILEGVLKSQNISGNEHLRRQEFALLTISKLINIIRSTTNDLDGSSLFHISEERRLQLHSALEISLPPFTEWLFINFPLAVSSNVCPSLLNSAVNCFKSFCTWMSNLNVEGIENFLQSSLEILFKSNDEELSINVLDALQLFFTIKNFCPSEQKVLEFYLISLFPQICQLLSRFSSQTNEETSYQKLKLLIQSYFSIGNRYICSKKNPLIVKNISEIISLFISIGQIPSLSIYSDLLDFLSNLIRFPPSNLNFKDQLPQLFLLIATKLGQSVKAAYKSSYYNEIDFEEQEEFKEFWKIPHSRSCDLIKLLTLKFPDQLLEYSYNSLGTFIQSGSFDNSQWEGLLLIEEYISRGLDQLDKKYSQKCLLHLQLLMIHSPLPSDLVVLDRWITNVKCFTALQGSQCPIEDFRRSIEKLFNIAICPDRPDHIRSHSALSILKLADSNVDLFSPLLEPLLSAISPLLSKPGVSWERRLFSELILIFMAQPSLPPNQQMILFSTVADPLVELLKNAKSVLFSASDPVLSLMKHLGFDELKSGSVLSDSSRKFSSDLNLLLSTLQILFKRIGPLVLNQPQSPVVQTCLQVLDELVGYLMLMIQCIHRIGTRQTWTSYFGSDLEYNMIYPKIQEYLEIGGSEDTDVTVNSNDTDAPCTNTTIVTPVVHVAGWIRHYRQISYLVLGLAATNFNSHFYSLPNLSERFMSQPLSSLESLNLADWNVLIKLLLKPVLASAPRDLVPVLVGSSLNGLLVMLGGKLEQEWSLVFAANSSTKPATGAALSLEMSRESKCNTLSHGFISFLSDLLSVPSIDNLKCISLLYALEKDNLLPQLEPGSSLSATWLFSEAPVDLVFLLGDFLGKAMTNWPRSVGVFARLINLQMYLISGVMGRQDLPNRSEFLSKSVNYALSCWSLASWSDHQTILLALLAEQFKWSFLALALENHSGLMLFDPDSIKFLKSFNLPVFSQFENELILKFKLSSGEIQNLRTSLLGNENLKSQRSALRTFLTKHSKTLVLVNNEEMTKQKEFSSRLAEMKKRIGRKGTAEIEENENLDSLLSDLFNVE